ncbi:retrotransposon protein, putative, ty1-copia subclass [Tanacetum coccineum]|uniref:Retrotransposon protein, putative, ty1-copia subclass n=1 Tax=Tanacetum coccineum TaxID=301880 RepID=A0ABQ4ZQT8_9ASTR
MLKKLKTLISQQAEQELLQTTRDFHSCKQEEGQSVSSYVLKIKGYIDNLERLGHPVSLGLAGLRVSRKLKPGALSLYVGNGQRKAIEAIGVFHLCLPSGLEIVLNNFQYAPSIIRGVISVSRLYEDGFVNCFVNNTIQVSRNNMVYFSAIPRDGNFEIDLSNSYTNDSSMYVVSNKRAKLDLDSALLWHCRLGHISKKRIKKLQHDRLLNSTNLRAFEKCVSCMSGKMEKKPYTHQVERAKDLLGLIHTDVCGTFKIMSRQGASYFITFTDDFSRHGYVYFQTTLLKSFWDYALETAARILNMVPTKKVERQPLRTDKLDPRSIKCIFIGYPKETMGYSFYYPPENKVLVARNAEFLENNLIDQEASGSPEDLEIIQEEDTHPSIDTSLNHEEDDLEMDEPQSDIIPIRRISVNPLTIKAALLDPESDKWLTAMNVEMQSMKDNEVWILVELPPNGKTVGSKWLFK